MERVRCPNCDANHNAFDPEASYRIEMFWRVFCICGTPMEYTGEARCIWILDDWEVS